jgi:hypothetical protein
MSFMLTNLGGFGAGGDNIGGNDSFTKLLLHCDAADGTTTFTDSSAAAHTITPGGNAQIDTAQAKFGASSVLFDGTGDFLVADGHADFAFGTGDFAIDFWLRPNAINAFKALYDSRPSATEGAYPVLFFDGSGTFSSSNVLFYYQSSAVRITGTTPLAHRYQAVPQRHPGRLDVFGQHQLRRRRLPPGAGDFHRRLDGCAEWLAGRNPRFQGRGAVDGELHPADRALHSGVTDGTVDNHLHGTCVPP